MKKLLVLIVIILIAVFAFWQIKPLNTFAANIIYVSPCDAPLTYKIGSVDPRFNLSEDAFKQDIQEAAGIWDTAQGKKLFSYDPKGDITISMVYDERQSLTNKINTLDTTLDTQKGQLTPQLEEYKKRVSEFKQRLAAFNQQVAYWNQQGGAPEDEYNKLNQEQESLQRESNELSAMAQSLNQSTEEYNQDVQELNSTVDVFNTQLKGKPEEGQYTEDKNGKKIVIFFNTTKDELIHTLTHELGHALHMNHVSNVNSIMHPLTNEVVTPSSSDLRELSLVCEKRNIFEVLFSNSKFLIPGSKTAN